MNTEKVKKEVGRCLSCIKFSQPLGKAGI